MATSPSPRDEPAPFGTAATLAQYLSLPRGQTGRQARAKAPNPSDNRPRPQPGRSGAACDARARSVRELRFRCPSSCDVPVIEHPVSRSDVARVTAAPPRHNGRSAGAHPGQPPSLTVTDPAGPPGMPWDECRPYPCAMCASVRPRVASAQVERPARPSSPLLIRGFRGDRAELRPDDGWLAEEALGSPGHSACGP
jgi:hypothetical protein